ncbi:MAG: hypothetical protein PHP89_06995, partial [Candidatus Omnitrophica bacterium]|nr:hypothetical protein [Candidatus Omnitrophota bacterium]
VARLAAAVKGKPEEDGKEALRKAISAIWEEAEHSPTVEALFGGEDYDGGTRETVSREELKVVLRKILSGIDQNQREYAQSAFWSLSEAGVITAGNLKQVSALFLAIAKGAGGYAWLAYKALGAIAGAVKEEELNPVVLDLDLLLAIAKGAGGYAQEAYQALGAIAKAGVITADNLRQVSALLLAIAEGTGGYAWLTYKALDALAGAVKEEKLKPVVLDLNLLFAIAKGAGEYAWEADQALGAIAKAGVITTDNLRQVSSLLLAIAEGTGGYAWKAYKALGALVESVKEEKLNPVVLDLKLLLAIAEGAGEDTVNAYSALDPLAKNLQEKDFEGLLKPDLLSEAITGYLALKGLEVNVFINLLTEFVTKEVGLIRANFQKRLEQYVYRMAFYKQVYDRLPGSYEELNNNTYIGVIQEQGLDVLMAYVARLAAAVKGKPEEDGKEALRKAISAIWEEAEHSPTVEALFGPNGYDGSVVADDGKRLAGNALTEVNFTHDKNDGGTGKAVSREELSVVLQEILKEIDPNHREYAQSAFWSLSEAGVITAGNLEQVSVLLLAIAEGAGVYAGVAYQALGAIAEAGVITAGNLEQVSALLFAIAEGTGVYVGVAYQALGAIAEAGAITAGNLEQVSALLFAIAKRIYARDAYQALGALAGAGAITAGNLEQVSALLLAIAKRRYAGVAYKALAAIAEAGVITADNFEQVSVLFLAIAQGARGYYSEAAYKALGALAKAGAITVDNIEQVHALFLAIAKGARESAWYAYYALAPLAKNLQEKDFAGLLNPDLLSATITGYLALKGLEVNKFIGLLTEFVTEEEGLIRANFQKRLEQYVYRMAFYKKVYDKLPESYEELNKNTYIKVIQEQGFDVLEAYVARLAAAVRGKSEEDGKEALRETISAIREEAEHSPTVEALFGGEDYDGGTRE